MGSVGSKVVSSPGGRSGLVVKGVVEKGGALRGGLVERRVVVDDGVKEFGRSLKEVAAVIESKPWVESVIAPRKDLKGAVKRARPERRVSENDDAVRGVIVIRVRLWVC